MTVLKGPARRPAASTPPVAGGSAPRLPHDLIEALVARGVYILDPPGADDHGRSDSASTG